MTSAQQRVDLRAPLATRDIAALHAGDQVFVHGTLYTARDAAHKRLCAALAASEPLPIDLDGQMLYYVGPAPAPPGRVIGSAGPTTSARMDPYTPELIARSGLRAMIGKGPRGAEVVAAMRDHACVYLAATGGAAALLSECIEYADVVAYDDLGPEAIHRLEVSDFPAVVAIDSSGKSLYRAG